MRADLPAVPAAQRGNRERPNALPKANLAHALRKLPGSRGDESGEHATAPASMPVPKGTVPHGASVRPPPLGRPLFAPTEGEWEAELARHKRRVDDEEAEWRLLRERARAEEEREWKALRARVEEDEWKALRERARREEEKEWSQLISEAKQRAALTIAEVNEDRAWEQQRARSEAVLPTRAPTRTTPVASSAAHPFDTVAPQSTPPRTTPRAVYWP